LSHQHVRRLGLLGRHASSPSSPRAPRRHSPYAGIRACVLWNLKLHRNRAACPKHQAQRRIIDDVVEDSTMRINGGHHISMKCVFAAPQRGQHSIQLRHASGRPSLRRRHPCPMANAPQLIREISAILNSSRVTTNVVVAARRYVAWCGGRADQHLGTTLRVNACRWVQSIPGLQRLCRAMFGKSSPDCRRAARPAARHRIGFPEREPKSV